MFGNNPIRRTEKGDGTQLQVQEIFPTVQGEGPRTGEASIFIRLGGCNLACSFCDTEFEDFQSLSLDEVMDRVLELDDALPRNLVVITGGEPLRQNIVPLCEALLAEGFQPQIETNGTLWRELPPQVEVVCSPKAPQGKYAPIRPDVLERATALKFIVSQSRAPYDQLPEFVKGDHIWLQPMDEYDPVKNQQNLKHTLALAERYNARVSLQTHKLFRID